MAPSRYVRNKGRRCRNCGSASAYARGRCEPCYRWWRRHGTERPEEVQVAHGRRRFEDAGR